MNMDSLRKYLGEAIVVKKDSEELFDLGGNINLRGNVFCEIGRGKQLAFLLLIYHDN